MSEPTGRTACVAQMLITLLADYNQPTPEGAEWNTKVRAWGMALDEVPLEEFPRLTAYIVKHHKTSFMPAAGEALKYFEAMTGNRAGTANAAAYQKFKPEPRRELPSGTEGAGRAAWRGLGERMRRGLGPVLCDCGVPALLTGIAWECGNKRTCRFFCDAFKTDDAPATIPGPLFEDGAAFGGLDVPSYTETEMLAELYRVGFDTANELAVPFAHEMRARCGAPTEWTTDTAKATWREWMGSRKAAQ